MASEMTPCTWEGLENFDVYELFGTFWGLLKDPRYILSPIFYPGGSHTFINYICELGIKIQEHTSEAADPLWYEPSLSNSTDFSIHICSRNNNYAVKWLSMFLTFSGGRVWCEPYSTVWKPSGCTKKSSKTESYKN